LAISSSSSSSITFIFQIIFAFGSRTRLPPSSSRTWPAQMQEQPRRRHRGGSPTSLPRRHQLRRHSIKSLGYEPVAACRCPLLLQVQPPYPPL
jgi:hypothetical protein